MSEAKRCPSADGSCALEIRGNTACIVNAQGQELANIEYGGECTAAAISNSRTHVALALRNLLFTYTYLLEQSNNWGKQGVSKAESPPPASLHFEEPPDPRYPPVELVSVSREGVRRVLWPKH